MKLALAATLALAAVSSSEALTCKKYTVTSSADGAGDDIDSPTTQCTVPQAAAQGHIQVDDLDEDWCFVHEVCDSATQCFRAHGDVPLLGEFLQAGCDEADEDSISCDRENWECGSCDTDFCNGAGAAEASVAAMVAATVAAVMAQ